MNLSLIEDLNINGHLTILKIYKDGKEETVFDDHNIIVSGMGAALAHLFATSGSDLILDYQIDRFQVGVSGSSDNETYFTNSLSGPLSSASEYGTNTNLVVVSGYQIKNDLIGATPVYYSVIPDQNITRVDSTTVRYTLVLDEFTANNLTRGSDKIYLSEIGLFVKNPKGAETDSSILVAYRVFDDIYKTSDFSLVFRWSINF